jgi:hypothetical protein
MPPKTYQVDSNHTGIRVAVLAAFVLTSLLGIFVVVPWLVSVLGLRNVPQVCLASVGGVALGAGVAWWAERVLLRVWPSGDTLQADGDNLELSRRHYPPVTIRWADRINVQSWYFVVRRGRSWVPRGWLCLACRLSQDEVVIAPYTFVSPSAARDLPQWAAFEELISQKKTPGAPDAHQPMEAPEQARLLSAEKERWIDGCELRVEDFVDLIARLDERLADWPG